MAKQSTTSAAFKQLRPLQNTNTGAIVEEHFRFWKKYKDDAESKKLTREAKEKEFKRKVAKQTFDTYDGLAGQDADGYFREQIINYKNQNSEKWVDLAKRVNSGDESAIVLFNQEKEKLANLINASKVVSAKSAELVKQKADGTFNEHLDQDLLNFNEQLAKSNYALDPKLGKFRIYDKDNPEVLLEVDPLRLTNEYLSANFNKAVDFTATGATLAKNLLDSVDGDKQITPQTNLRGVQLAINEFSQDPTLAKSWYRSQQKTGQNTNRKDFEELDNVELSNLATSFYEQAIRPNISETVTDTTTKDARDEQALINARLEAQRKRQLLAKGEKDAAEGATTIEVTTTEEGDTISAEITASGQPVSTEILGETMFTIKGGFSVDEVEGDKDTRTTYTNFARGKDGIVAIGRKTIETPVLDENGNQVTDDDGVVELTEETITIVEKNKTKLGNIATRLSNKDGSRFKNLKELDDELKGLEKPVTEKIEETPEERRVRLRKQAGL